MNTYITKKRLLPALALACLAPLVSQNVLAASTFSSYATVTYTINSLTNLTNPGDLNNPPDFSGLGITGSFELAPDQAIQTITGAGSVTPSLANAGTTTLPPAIGSSYSRTFQLDGDANNGGEVAANYLAWYGLAFENTSATDSYDVGLTLSYELSANASGDNAFTDVTLNYFNENGVFAGSNYISATTQASGTANLTNSPLFSFTLAPAGSETLSLDAGITGTLQASPVPVPSAIWLFSSALLAAMPGIRKFRSTV